MEVEGLLVDPLGDEVAGAAVSSEALAAPDTVLPGVEEG